MIGMHASTGKALSGDAHLAQSITIILTTPVGTRVMRRDFGSLLPELIDAPFNQSTRIKLYGAIASALMRWEPRLRLSSLAINAASTAGQFVLDIIGQRTDASPATEYTRLSVPLNFTTS